VFSNEGPLLFIGQANDEYDASIRCCEETGVWEDYPEYDSQEEEDEDEDNREPDHLYIFDHVPDSLNILPVHHDSPLQEPNWNQPTFEQCEIVDDCAWFSKEE